MENYEKNLRKLTTLPSSQKWKLKLGYKRLRQSCFIWLSSQ